ncbi:transcription factor/nuclear export subunit protein 2-domain-containing protein [Ostreococcus tauri]|uniref:THO complex subunit 2 n=1 Tax=Ostreococcus tauri TaxID=70448 RepID=A0A1Y5HXS4_OSTTA|nr:transcription factor/nuclear export subunit protein 2-domain-containing protein [Ostreococcus tauri]
MLGPSLACIPLLYLQVLPYLSCLLRQESERAGVLRIVASCILPGMSCMKPNPMISRQLWEVLCRLSFAERGRIYQSVLHLSNGWSDAMKTSERRAGVATYRILRRLSRENVKFLGRKLGKLVSCFPINTSIIILEHVEAYPNMIDPIVGSLKYSNSLALDVLLHQLLRRLSNGRDKLKTDGQHVATWFSALCSFTGILCKKYPRVELRAVVHYILGALKDGESVDLLILRELIESMAGIKVVQDMSEDKMLLGCAGPHLRMFRNSQAGPTLEHTKGAARLRVALSTADTCNTTARMLLLIARCRHDFIQTARSEQLKFISQWYDECHHVFLQYVSFLRMAYTAEECFRVLPTACSLTKDYGLEPSVVYHIFRPHFTCLQRATGCSSNSHDCEAVDVKAVLDDWENAIPCETLRFISSDMYTTFWRLNLDDVFIHDEGYSTAIIACEAKVKAFEHVLQRTKGENPEAIAGMSNFSAHIKNLASERAKKTAANQALVEALKQFSKSWITSEDRCGVVRCILEHMIFPRVKMSGLDAYYAARFISLLHELDTPLFNALLYQDRLIRDFNQLAHACSPRENSQLGMYMLCSLNQFLRWREKSIYALQCQPFNTFSIPSTRAWRQANWDDYSIISYNWQVRLTKAILTQLDKGGYMELRNILEILVRIIPKFPSIHSQGAHIRKRIMRLRKLDHRSDIQTIATRYLAMLDAGRNNWISDDDFRNA